MIEPNELRIGNWVVGSHSDRPLSTINHQVTGFDLYGRRTDFFAPTPLTPEILQRCGFEISFSLGRNQALKFIYSRRVLVSFYKNGRTDIIIDGDKSVSTFSKKFNGKKLYLHQLQNLYFALTGEELKINLNVEAVNG